MCVSFLLLLGANQSPADVPGVIKVVMLRALEVNNGILGHWVGDSTSDIKKTLNYRGGLKLGDSHIGYDRFLVLVGTSFRSQQEKGRPSRL